MVNVSNWMYQSQWGLDFRRDMTVLYNMTGNYSTQLFTDEALSIIRRHDTTEVLVSTLSGVSGAAKGMRVYTHVHAWKDV